MSDTPASITATPELLGPELFAAFEAKGYTTLTAVQAAVLGADRESRDLRISSQTGSGKTIAIGLALFPRLVGPRQAPPQTGKAKNAFPRALVITPTRELGRQVEEELSWLFAKLKVQVTAVTGGQSYIAEHRALARNPDIIVATPGRLIDHLEKGAIDPSHITAVVLDEADRMLDMGFSESLETILSKVPPTRRTHLVSATFSSEVRYLADKIQSAPQHLEGTRLGAANADISHVLYLVDPRERLDALVNLLLAHAESRTLVFTRTRAGVAELEGALSEAGFRVAALSGEMAQRERTKALEGFKRGAIRILVATDVAARGIDVSDISLVLHMEPPNDPDTYTHRSGRTGRAGRKGTSAVLVAEMQLRKAHAVLSRANVRFRLLPMPTPSTIRQAQDALLLERLTTGELDVDERTQALAQRIVAAAAEGEVPKVIARLLAESGLTQGPEPREVRVILPQPERARRMPTRPDFDGPPRRDFSGPPPRRDFDGPRRDFDGPPRRDDRRGPAPREDRAPFTEMPASAQVGDARALPRPSRPQRGADGAFETFQVSWGERHGADPRRMVAILCRRGDITSADIGAIRVGPASSTVEVRRERAAHFLEHAQQPDPRDPRVRVRPLPGYWEEDGRPEGGDERPIPDRGPVRHAPQRAEAWGGDAGERPAPRGARPPQRRDDRGPEAERALPVERGERPLRRAPASHGARPSGPRSGGHAPPRKKR